MTLWATSCNILIDLPESQLLTIGNQNKQKQVSTLAVFLSVLPVVLKRLRKYLQ